MGPDLPDNASNRVTETPVTQLDLAIRGGTIVTASDELTLSGGDTLVLSGLPVPLALAEGKLLGTL